MINMFQLQALFTVLFFSVLPLFGETANIVDHGAIGDGEFLNTDAIQSAIDRCHDQGGGKVYVPAGKFRTGTIILRSHVSLYLEAGAVLLGSTRLNDYPEIYPAFRSYTDVNYVDKSLIYAEKAEHISICGEGTIDGQGGSAVFDLPGRDNYKKRPYLIRMVECRSVRISGISLVNSAMWVQHYLACEDLLIEGIGVKSLVNRNNDGIDIDCCSRVRISNCNIESGDDAIVLKATAPKDCEMISISNCILRSRCNAFKMGTESTGGFKDILVSHCVVYDTRLAAVALEMVDGGTMDRVQIDNITANGTAGGIFMRLGNRARHHLAMGSGGSERYHFEENEQLDKVGMGSMQNITISNFICRGADTEGCCISGIPGFEIRNITLRDVHISFAGEGAGNGESREIPENESDYPEYKMFGKLPAYGIFVRHVRNISLYNVRLDHEVEDSRPALFFDDVKGLVLSDLHLEKPAGKGPAVVYSHTAGIQSDRDY
jgi:polygalacturonase